MNRILKYRGKTLDEMNVWELENQLKFNKIRMIYRSLFFAISALAIMITSPAVAIIPISFALITGYWLLQNNNAIKEEIKIRR